MARPKAPIAISSRKLNSAELQSGIVRLHRRIEELNAYDVTASADWSPPDLEAIEKAIEDSLERIFGHATTQFYRYQPASHLSFTGPGVYVVGFDYETPQITTVEVQAGIRDNIQKSISLISQAIRTLEEDLAEQGAPARITIDSPAKAANSKKVFIVHGHDEAAKEKAARFLTKIGFDPVILHEQANAGQTIIEKFEKHGDVGFAVVLLTPDDIGGPRGRDVQPRARQNVILELGYFVGRLGRKRVCALKTGDLEVPSDFAGVVYEEMDPAGAWQTALARELQEAGHEIDWNQVMRR